MNTILIKTSFIGKDGYYCNEEESCSADYVEFKKKRIIDRWYLNIFKESNNEDMAFKLNKICNVKNITFKIESEIIKTED